MRLPGQRTSEQACTIACGGEVSSITPPYSPSSPRCLSGAATVLKGCAILPDAKGSDRQAKSFFVYVQFTAIFAQHLRYHLQRKICPLHSYIDPLPSKVRVRCVLPLFSLLLSSSVAFASRESTNSTRLADAAEFISSLRPS